MLLESIIDIVGLPYLLPILYHATIHALFLCEVLGCYISQVQNAFAHDHCVLYYTLVSVMLFFSHSETLGRGA